MKITDEEKVELRNKAKVELERLEAVFNNNELEKEINEFKNRFLICEVIYKVILKEHQYRIKGKYSDVLKLDMRQVPYALAFAGYNFDEQLLTLLFGAEEHVGRRSAKKLRDALTPKTSEMDNPALIEPPFRFVRATCPEKMSHCSGQRAIGVFLL